MYMLMHFYTIIVIALNHSLYSYNCDVSLSHVCLVLACNSKIKREDKRKKDKKVSTEYYLIAFPSPGKHKETT